MRGLAKMRDESFDAIGLGVAPVQVSPPPDATVSKLIHGHGKGEGGPMAAKPNAEQWLRVRLSAYGGC